MNKSLIAAGLLVATALSVPAFACPGGGPGAGGPGGKQQAMQQRMADDLKLSDKQKAQFKKIHEDSNSIMAGMRDAMRNNREAMQALDPTAPDYMARADQLAAEKGAIAEGMARQHARVQSEMAAILTPEQNARHAQLRKDRQAKWKEMRGDWDKGRGQGGNGPRNGQGGMGGGMGM